MGFPPNNPFCSRLPRVAVLVGVALAASVLLGAGQPGSDRARTPVGATGAKPAPAAAGDPAKGPAATSPVPEAKHAGGEPDGIVQVANLVYAGTKSSQCFADHPLRPIDMGHPMFHTVYEIRRLTAKHGEPRPLEGISLGGRMGVVYSQDGLNDTPHTQGCCCCGGNEILNAIEVNVNILAYALTY